MLEKISESKIQTDPRVRRTRRLLTDALTALIQEKLFQKITVQDITERAEVNRSTFYAHFDDKFALLTYMIREGFREEIINGIPQPPRFTIDNLRQLAHITYDVIVSMTGHCGDFTIQNHLPYILSQLRSCLYDEILTWIDDDQDSPSAEVLAVVTSSAIFGSVVQWAGDLSGESIEDLLDEILPLIVEGVDLFIQVD